MPARAGSGQMRTSDIRTLGLFSQLSGNRGDVPGTERVLVFEEPLVGRRDAVAQVDAMAPSHLVQLRHIEQLARRAVRLRRIEREDGLWIDRVAHRLRQLAD